MTRGTGTFFLFIAMLVFAIFLAPELGMTDGVAVGALTTTQSSLDGNTAPQLTFAGKLVDPQTNKWLNDYLVLLYLEGQEVSRARTSRMKYSPAGQGVYDGMFALTVPNVYELRAKDEFRYTNGAALLMQTAVNANGAPTQLFTWYESLTPGRVIRIDVPEKRVQYALVILALPAEDLPVDILDQPTTLDERGHIATVKQNSIEIEHSNEKNWNRELRGISGTLHDVYTYYVQNQVPGMSWDQFQAEVLHFNPQLRSSGYTFQTGVAYLLPQLPLAAQ